MKVSNLYMYVLGAVISLAIIAVVIMLIVFPIPAGNGDILKIILGALVTAFVTVVMYFFGSSKSSADKTELLTKKKEEQV